MHGLGENVPMSTANLNDGFVGLKDAEMVMLRIPYPLGFASGLFWFFSRGRWRKLLRRRQ